MLIGLEKEIKKFKQELFRISWYMRGGVSVNDLLAIYTWEDRQAIYEVVNENMETTKNTGIPFV